MHSYRFHFESSIPASVLANLRGPADEISLKTLVAEHFKAWTTWDIYKAQGNIPSHQELSVVIHLQRSFYEIFEPQPEWPLYRGLCHAIEATDDIFTRLNRIHRSVARTILYRVIRAFSTERLHPDAMHEATLEAIEQLIGLKPGYEQNAALLALRQTLSRMPAAGRAISLWSDEELHALVNRCEAQAFHDQPEFPEKSTFVHKPGSYPTIDKAFPMFIPLLEQCAESNARLRTGMSHDNDKH